MVKRILVTGGSGFIGSALVKALLHEGNSVRVLDNNSRGAKRRLREVEKDIEFIEGDIRDAETVASAVRNCDEVQHLAFVNGTKYFYSAPEIVLEVGIKGIVNVLDACRRANVPTIVLASSSEVYQTPPKIPTDEAAPLSVPDPYNPRMSYAVGKIASEVMTINYGRKFFDRVLIFRPHNVYGPDMGWDHVIPQFALRTRKAAAVQPSGPLPFAIEGNGQQTRSFCYIDDLVHGVMLMRAKGEHLGIYHIGTTEEIAIADLARRVAAHAGREIVLQFMPAPAGSAERRCPDIGRMQRLGYAPQFTLDRGLPPTLDWYWQNEHLAPGD
ncbi:MAG TPA: SDR family NAD(P)-dependent oxidoreductase [Xanthobacteraceae bacterium]|nr:SDR family NAD(P)-dependent oxidoreductase [Xanthobacteraceae bacterium]